MPTAYVLLLDDWTSSCRRGESTFGSNLVTTIEGNVWKRGSSKHGQQKDVAETNGLWQSRRQTKNGYISIAIACYLILAVVGRKSESGLLMEQEASMETGNKKLNWYISTVFSYRWYVHTYEVLMMPIPDSRFRSTSSAYAVRTHSENTVCTSTIRDWLSYFIVY